MTLKTLVAGLVLLASMSGLASAAPKGDAIQDIDLTAVGGKVYYLACSGPSTAACGIVQLWEEENKKPGLQKLGASGASDYGRDLKLTL